MSYAKVCLNCETPFEAKRDSARFCGDDCRNEWHTTNRAAVGDAGPQRVEPHALDEVRALHEEHKGDWTLIVREHARRTLFVTGYLSAADFEALGVPDEHRNLPNAQIGGLASAGHMEAISFKRWSTETKASRKSGKYWIYRITPKGKEHLSTLVGSNSGASGGTGVATVRSGEKQNVGVDVDHHGDGEGAVSVGINAPAVGVDPGVQVDAGQVTGKRDRGRSPFSSSAAGIDSPDVMSLDDARPKAPSAYDPWAA